MSDWKERVEEIERAKHQKKEYEHEKRLRKHQAEYKCHICGQPSTGPGKDRDGYIEWSSYNGLTSCSSCMRLACSDHIHLGTCKSCSQDWLAGKSYVERGKIKGWIAIACSFFLGAFLFALQNALSALGLILIVAAIYFAFLHFTDHHL